MANNASEYSDPKIFWNFLDPGEQADLVYPGPKISENFWAWVVPFERLGLFGGFKLHPPP